MVALRLALLSVVSVAVCSIYLDQIGASDRLESYFGPIQKLSPLPPSFPVTHSFALTEAQVAAVINTKSKEIVWRYVAPTGERIGDAVVHSTDSNVGVAALLSIDSHACRMKVLRLADGAVLAEQIVASDLELNAPLQIISHTPTQLVVMAGDNIQILNYRSTGLSVAASHTASSIAGLRPTKVKAISIASFQRTLHVTIAQITPDGAYKRISTFKPLDDSWGVFADLPVLNNNEMYQPASVTLAFPGKVGALFALSTSGNLVMADTVLRKHEFLQLDSDLDRVLQVPAYDEDLDRCDTHYFRAVRSDGSGALVSLQGTQDGVKLLHTAKLAEDEVAVMPPAADGTGGYIISTNGIRYFGVLSDSANPSVAALSAYLSTRPANPSNKLVHAFVVKAGKDGSALRFILVAQDGLSAAIQSNLLWTSHEGAACTVDMLSVDLPMKPLTASDAASGGVHVSFADRLTDQLRLLQSVLASAQTSLASVAADPAGTLQEWVSGTSASHRQMRPLPGDVALRKIELLRYEMTSKFLGGKHRCVASLRPRDTGSASVVAADFETGERLWSKTYQGSKNARDTFKLLASRPRPVGAFKPEVVLFAAAGSKHPIIEWLDVESGSTTQTATVPIDSNHVNTFAKLPFVLEASDREVHAAVVEGPFGVQVAVFPFDSALRVAIENHPGGVSIIRDYYDADADADAVAALKLGSDTQLCKGEQAVCLFSTSVSWRSYFGERSSHVEGHRILAMGWGSYHPVSVTSNKASAGAALDLSAAAAASMGDDSHVMPAQVLGDDSLLVKYLNPNTFYVVYGTRGTRPSAYEAERVLHRAASDRTQGTPSLRNTVVLSLIDGVSGRVLYSKRHVQATGPVAAVQHENWLVYSYWNAKAVRPELSVVTLFDGLINTYDMTPWNNKALEAMPKGDVSSTTQDIPVVLHRSYILPLSITGITVTRTRYGRTTPAFLMSTVHDGVLLVDKRLLDPRRPAKEPTETEKAEGLMQYSPVLPLRHSSLVTYNHTIPGLHFVQSSASAFESTTHVTAIGVDHFFARVAPAKTFDQLDPSFSVLFFLAVVAATGGVVYAVDQMVKRKEVAKAWR